MAQILLLIDQHFLKTSFSSEAWFPWFPYNRPDRPSRFKNYIYRDLWKHRKRPLLLKHITQGQLESPEKQNAAQLTVMEKTLSSYWTYAMRSHF